MTSKTFASLKADAYARVNNLHLTGPPGREHLHVTKCVEIEEVYVKEFHQDLWQQLELAKQQYKTQQTICDNLEGCLCQWRGMVNPALKEPIMAMERQLKDSKDYCNTLNLTFNDLRDKYWATNDVMWTTFFTDLLK